MPAVLPQYSFSALGEYAGFEYAGLPAFARCALSVCQLTQRHATTCALPPDLR
jgi:hypothetical protein